MEAKHFAFALLVLALSPGVGKGTTVALTFPAA